MYRSCQLRVFLRWNSSVNGITTNDIKIPKKICRDDLTVLKALSGCVRSERGIPEYGAIDQPFTIPKDSFMRKKVFLSKASGRLSARMAFKEMKHDFINVAVDEPKVKSLLPLIEAEDVEQAVHDKKITAEEGLKQLIRLMSSEDAWSFYEAHKESNFSEEVTLELLQLLCASGGESLFLEKPSEDIYFSYISISQWRLDCSAELLFLNMNNKSNMAYLAMIRGSAKYNDPLRALDLYRDMCEKHPNASLDLATTNSLLYSLHYSKLSDDNVREVIVELLEKMSHDKVVPSAHTFNNAIFAFAQRSPIEFVESLYQEMITIGVKPTLGTYAVLLKCSFQKSFVYDLLYDVIIILEQRHRDIEYEDTTSIDDRTLFTTAMELCFRFNDTDLARRLHSVVDNGGRFHLFINDLSRSDYFDFFIRVLLRCSDVDEAMEMASKYVPKYYNLRYYRIKEFIGYIAAITDDNRRTLLVLSLINVINWNKKRIMESDVWELVLNLLQTFPRSLGSKVADCLQKVFDITKSRSSSVLKLGTSLDNVIKIVLEADQNHPLLWSLIEYAIETQQFRVSVVAPIIISCFNTKDFDKVMYLWKCLSDLADKSKIGSYTTESTNLVSIIDFTHTVILPTLVKFNVNVKELTNDVLKCRVTLSDKSDSE